VTEPADLLSALETLAHFKKHKEPLTVLRTPFEGLNAQCRDDGGGVGLAMGWYVILAGDTGHGKSLLALQLGMEAVLQGLVPAFVSMEMGIRQLRTRFLAMLTKIPAWKLEPGEGFQETTMKQAVGWLDDYRHKNGYHPFTATDEPFGHYAEVLEWMEVERVERGATVFILDYLQLCEAPNEAGIAQEIKRISKAVRDYAHGNRVLVIALSQYNNESGNDRSRRPHAGSLYGGRRLAQDSDLTICIDHSRYERTDDGSKARTWLLTVKNRHGGYPEIPIEWDYQTLCATAALPHEEHLWPGEKP
jgi:replicative DNA helicase